MMPRRGFNTWKSWNKYTYKWMVGYSVHTNMWLLAELRRKPSYEKKTGYETFERSCLVLPFFSGLFHRAFSVPGSLHFLIASLRCSHSPFQHLACVLPAALPSFPRPLVCPYGVRFRVHFAYEVLTLTTVTGLSSARVSCRVCAFYAPLLVVATTSTPWAGTSSAS